MHPHGNVIDIRALERPERKRLVQQLFDQHARVLRRFFQARAIPQDEIDDLVQELFARLMRVDDLDRVMSDSTGSNRSYLLTMANNMIFDRRRKQQVRSAHEAAPEAQGEPVDDHTAERIVAAQFELEAMKAVIRDMRPNWRMAFVLQRFRNMSYEEIALHMGVSEKQVERYLMRAMRRIREARPKIATAGKTSW